MSQEEKKTNEVKDLEESKGLSAREALEVALEATKAGPEESPKVQVKVEEEPKAEEPPPLEPPSEFNAEEKEDFRQLSRKQQEAQLRLHSSRLSTLSEIKRAKSEYDSERQLVEAMRPFLKRMDLKEPAEVALKKALKLWSEFETGDPRANMAAYLKAKGVEVPKELLETKTEAPQNLPLQKKLEELTLEIDRLKNAPVAESKHQAFQKVEQTKNAAGKARFPDLDNSERGLRLSRQIGSLVYDDTPLAKQFIATTRDRIPDISYEGLIVEAYKYLGGRVDDSADPNARSQDTQKHIVRSNRAASSVPVGGKGSFFNGEIKKFKSAKEALAQALKDHAE